MTSTSSKAGIKRSNGFAFETNHRHQLFWTECWYLVTRQIFEHVLDPRWWIVYSHFHTATLRLFQTFIFYRKLANLLIELWKLFYHSYFDKQGLILPDWQLINKTFRLTYYAINFILILPMNALMSICRNQDHWLLYGTKRSPWVFTALENNACVDRCDFFAFDRLCNHFCFCSRRWMAVISVVGKHVVVVKVNIAENCGCAL